MPWQDSHSSGFFPVGPPVSQANAGRNRWHGVGTSEPLVASDTCAPRVLVIEDDRTVRDSIQALLEYLGYECGLAADGPSGLRLFEGEPWDLVLTDLTLPGMSGLDVVEVIRRRAPTRPMILITGADDPFIRSRAREHHVLLVLKPFGLDTLKAAVVDALYAQTQ